MNTGRWHTVLSDTTNGKTQTGVEITILDQDVGAIGLERDAVVSIVNDPVPERDVVHVYSVCSIGLVGACQ